MDSKHNISSIFFKDLKSYNKTTFRCLKNCVLDTPSPEVLKAFSSVITRYYIFCEKHPEIPEVDKRILYFKVKIDLIARFFANFPSSKLDELKPFQDDLLNYVVANSQQNDIIEDDNEQQISIGGDLTNDATEIPNIELGSTAPVQV